MGVQNSALETVWVFNGERARFAAGIFRTEQEGLAWVKKHGVSGILTEYPVGGGCFDLAVEGGHFRPSKPHHGSTEFVAAFSPGWTRHVHVIDGSPDAA
jgi:hypothetical protein